MSTSVSPLVTLEPDAATFTVSADSRFSANSNEMRVRVEASKNRLTIVLPRSAGTFLIARSLISLNGSAVSRMRRIWSAESVLEAEQVLAERRASRLLRAARRTTASLPSSSVTSTSTRSPGATVERLARRRRRWIGSSRPPRSTSTASAMRAGRPKSAQLVERGAHRAAGVEHVVDDHDVLAVERPRQVGLARPPAAARRSAGRRDRG